MERRAIMKLLLVSAAPFALPASAGAVAPREDQPVPDARTTAPLDLPENGDIRVAFLIGDYAEIVDFGGPWGVFEYVSIDAQGRNPFILYTVAATTEPVAISGGMTIVPNYAITRMPAPDIIVVPAMDYGSLAPEVFDWLRQASSKTQLTMSVCNGSFVLAKAGLLNGRNASAHHGAYEEFATMFPTVNLLRGKRWVEDGKIATAGGLTSGQDLALRVVERYFGREVAKATAIRLEYQGTGWMYPDSNSRFG